MAAIIKQNPENCIAAAANLQNMFFTFKSSNRGPFQIAADRAGDGGCTVTMNKSFNSLHGDRPYMDCKK